MYVNDFVVLFALLCHGCIAKMLFHCLFASALVDMNTLRRCVISAKIKAFDDVRDEECPIYILFQ